MGVTVMDSAGVTCRYTPIEDLKRGDVVVVGWRTTVERVEVEGDQARVWWTRGLVPDQWNPVGTELPVEVRDE